MKQIYLIIIVFLAMVLLNNPMFAQYEFIENKGQWHENVNFKMELNDGALFIEDNGFTFNITDIKMGHHSHAHDEYEWHDENAAGRGHAYKVAFRNSKKPLKISSSDATSDYCNYFIGSDESKWASHVIKFRKVEYTGIYNNIDIRYSSDSRGMKYDFIVHPGGNYKDIQLEYIGTDGIEISEGVLIAHTTIRDIMEYTPKVYQIINGDTINISCEYILHKNIVGYKISESYDKNYDLVIDPSLVFSTYTGSTGDNWGFTATFDYNDNVFSGGIVFSTGYPTSTGAYQVTYAGGTPWADNATSYLEGCDIGIIKYNSNGTSRIYATYLGGHNGQEMPHSLVATESNQLVIMGTTGSPDFPTTANVYDRTFNGGTSVTYDNVIGFHNGVDIFVSKLSEDGSQLMGSTYIGGTGNDGLNFKASYTLPDPNTGINYVEMHGNDSLYYNYGDGARGEVVVNSKSYIYVGTNTFSSDFPTGINEGFQPTHGGGQDGVVFALSPDLSQLAWSSYIGGSQDDAIFSVSLDIDENVFVTGGTTSPNFPTTANAYNQTYNGGSTDAFVAKVAHNGTFLLTSTFFGSPAYDNAYFVRTDRNNKVYICGQTKCGGTVLVQNAEYYVANSGQFITKFNNDLTNVEWSTQFGTNTGKPNISITAFAVDVCNRVYLSGWGREWPFNYYDAQAHYYTWDQEFGTKNMQVTADAIQDTTDGMDFYVLVLNEDVSALEYATFFGELRYTSCSASGRDHVDGGTSRFDKKGHIIQSVCASCGGCQMFPASPSDVWSTTNNSTNCNNAVFKIRIIENLAEANFNPVPVGCAPYNVQFENTSQGTSFLWNFGDGTTSTQTNPSHTYTNGGTYTVMLIANDPASCNRTDTIRRFVTVVSPSPSTLDDITGCPNESVIIGPETDYPEGTTFEWIQGNGISNPYVQNPSVSPTQTSTYTLVAQGICNDTVTQTVNVIIPDVGLTTSNDTTICPGGTATLQVFPTGNAVAWEWSVDPNFSSIISTEQTIDVSPENSLTYYVRVRESECNTYATGQVRVTIHRFYYSLTPSHIICPNAQVQLTVTNNSTDQLSYQWQGAGIISGGNTNSPTVSPTSATTYTVTITNQMGCTTTDQVEVTIDNISCSIGSTTNNICHGYCEGTAEIIASGIEPYSYSWSNGQTTETATELCAGNYTITVTDGNSCTTTNSVTISEPPAITINFTNIQEPVCDGVGYGSATANVSGGTPGYTYQWDINDYTTATNNECLVGLNTITVTDHNGCTASSSIEMPAPGTLTSQTESITHVSCNGFCDGAISISASNGTPPYTYNWSNGEHGTEIHGLCAGRYVVTVIDADNCVSHQFAYITEPEVLQTYIQETNPILCFGGLSTINSISYGGTIPYSFVWSTGETTNTQIEVTAGNYSITVTDNHGCTADAYISVSQPEELKLTSIQENQLCDNNCNGKIETSVAGGINPYRYRWSNSETTSYIENLCSNDYSLTVTDANGCQLHEEYTISNLGYIPELDARISSNVIYRGEDVRLAAITETDGTYEWDNGKILDNNRAASPLAHPTENTLFTVEFHDGNNCIAIDTVSVIVKEVICGDPYIFVPNAFTPNGDGNNDFFRPFYPDAIVTELYFAVYDRWGSLVYETDNIRADGWNGTYKGKQLAPDVYVFWLKAKCINGEQYEHRGNVTLIR
ncbi:MAG: gliding motility-associated C-terminal domain-containing protein [Bacteroidales bacterium]|nr:gliding motility-associated C-terminal domain-containing protein [Bacteroidales bacterium]